MLSRCIVPAVLTNAVAYRALLGSAALPGSDCPAHHSWTLQHCPICLSEAWEIVVEPPCWAAPNHPDRQAGKHPADCRSVVPVRDQSKRILSVQSMSTFSGLGHISMLVLSRSCCRASWPSCSIVKDNGPDLSAKVCVHHSFSRPMWSGSFARELSKRILFALVVGTIPGHAWLGSPGSLLLLLQALTGWVTA